MQTKHKIILLSLIVLFFVTSTISYAVDNHINLSRNPRIYWTCIYHPQQRFYVTRMPGVQGCSYSPDKQHVWIENSD